MKELKALLMDESAVFRALKRISHEIVEKNSGVDNLYIIGIKSRGIPLAEILADNIAEIEGHRPPVGSVDISHYRDDLKEKPNEPIIEGTFFADVTDKRIVLVDDVLYTGRTVRAALEALRSFGRPACVQLAVLIDRGHRELPIRGDYVGKNVPTAKSETVAVKLPPYDGRVCVELYSGDLG